MRLRHHYTFILLILGSGLGSLLLSGFTFRFPDDYIFWSAGKKLSATDFKARPEAGNPMKAMTHSGIAYSWECSAGKLSFEVVARFDRNKSWMRPGAELKLLSHEQKHFDITELYARKMRKAFSEVENACRRGAQLDELAEKLYQEWDQTQIRYDEETNHGMDLEAQKEWEMWVDGELRGLEEWAVQ